MNVFCCRHISCVKAFLLIAICCTWNLLSLIIFLYLLGHKQIAP